jgi:hypothetical protein
MTNEIVALIIKAQNKNEAEQNAERVLYHICQEGDDPYYDYGIIIGNGRQSQPPPVVMKFREATKANTGLEPISSPWNQTNYPSFIQTSCVTTDSAKEFINWLSKDPNPGASGGKPMDENEMAIEQNDNRLRDKDYFIVPVRLHY